MQREAFFSVLQIHYYSRCWTVSKSRFREENNKVFANRHNHKLYSITFFFFLTKKTSISYLCAYVPSFCTFVFVAKHVISNDWFHWFMSSFISNEIRVYQNPITVDLSCFIYYTEAMFSIIIDQLFIRYIARPFSFFLRKRQSDVPNDHCNDGKIKDTRQRGNYWLIGSTVVW